MPKESPRTTIRRVPAGFSSSKSRSARMLLFVLSSTTYPEFVSIRHRRHVRADAVAGSMYLGSMGTGARMRRKSSAAIGVQTTPVASRSHHRLEGVSASWSGSEGEVDEVLSAWADRAKRT